MDIFGILLLDSESYLNLFWVCTNTASAGGGGVSTCSLPGRPGKVEAPQDLHSASIVGEECYLLLLLGGGGSAASPLGHSGWERQECLLPVPQEAANGN